MTAFDKDTGVGRVSLLRDGIAQLGAELFANLSPQEAADLLAAADAGDGPPDAPVNAYLLETDSRLILIDAGGAGMLPGLGGVADALAARGVRPDDVDTIFCTHLHPDHFGGLLSDGGAVFGKADLLVHADEIAFWGDDEIRAQAPQEAQGFFEGARQVIAVYGDQIQTFTGQTEIAPGVTTDPLPGHTPGHTGLRIGTGADQVFVWGDIVHVEAFQLPVPPASIAFDVDPAQAIATRSRILAEVAQAGTRIAGGHLSGSGFGHIHRVGAGYGYVAEAPVTE